MYYTWYIVTTEDIFKCVDHCKPFSLVVMFMILQI